MSYVAQSITVGGLRCLDSGNAAAGPQLLFNPKNAPRRAIVSDVFCVNVWKFTTNIWLCFGVLRAAVVEAEEEWSKPKKRHTARTLDV